MSQSGDTGARTRFNVEIVATRTVEIDVPLAMREAWERKDELTAPHIPERWDVVRYSAEEISDMPDPSVGQNAMSREGAIKTLLTLDVPGSGPLQLVQREAEAIIDALGLTWPPVPTVGAEAEHTPRGQA